MREPEDIAYVAGWFEARGYVRIGCQKSRTPRLTVYVRAPKSQCDWFVERYPGTSIQSLRAVGSYSNPIRVVPGGFHWTVTRLNALQLLQEIKPHLVFRRDFAEGAIEFLERVVVHDEKASDQLMILVHSIREKGRLGS